MTAPDDDEVEAIRARWTGDGPQAWRSGAEARDVRTLLAALDDARAEFERLRGKLTEMHRRAQRAEGIADRYAEGRPQGAHGRGIGRALANYAAHRATQQRDEAIAERDAARAEAQRERVRADLAEAALREGIAGVRDTARREAIGLAEAALREGIASVRDTARREAIEEAIAHAEAWEYERARNALGRAWQEGAEAARAAIVADLRALFDGPAREGRET